MEAIEFKLMSDALFKNRTETKFKERFKLFHGSSILNVLQSIQLNEWIGLSKTQEWKAIYIATRDGFSGNIFHQKCDNITPTITIIKTPNGNIFGGYTPCNWIVSTNGYLYDQNSFLFSLINTLGKPLKIVHSGSNLNSIYSIANYGPTFGSGHDIYCCNNSNTTSGSYSNLGYSFPLTDLPNYAYDSNNAKNLLAGSYNFLTSEIEVFQKK